MKHRPTGFRWPVPGKLGERTHPACCLRHLAANVSQRMTSGPTDVGVLMAVGRKQMRSAFPPDHRPGRHPTLTRLGLVQRWAVLEIPTGDQLRSGAAASRLVPWHPPQPRCYRPPAPDHHEIRQRRAYQIIDHRAASPGSCGDASCRPAGPSPKPPTCRRTDLRELLQQTPHAR